MDRRRMYVGWNGLGENISGGRATAEDTVDGWMSSPIHCANILNPNCTQNFGRR